MPTKGSVVRPRKELSSDLNFDPDTVSLTVTRPDGSSITPTVTIVPGTSADLQVATTDSITLSIAGTWIFTWSFDIISNATLPDKLIDSEEFFVSHIEVHDEIRQRLNLEYDQLTDDDIDRVLVRLLNSILRTFPCIVTDLGGYDALVGGDKFAFDNGLIWSAAAIVNPFMPKGPTSLVGDIVKIKQGPVSYETNYRISKNTPPTLEQNLLAQAYFFFQDITCIREALAETVSGRHIMDLRGPRRRFETKGITQNLINPLYAMIATDSYWNVFNDPLGA